MKVHVLLKTPLYQGRYGADRSRELKALVTEVRGEATSRDGGLDIVVASMHDQRGQPVDPPIRRLFLPLGKIDFYSVEE